MRYIVYQISLSIVPEAVVRSLYSRSNSTSEGLECRTPNITLINPASQPSAKEPALPTDAKTSRSRAYKADFGRVVYSPRKGRAVSMSRNADSNSNPKKRSKKPSAGSRSSSTQSYHHHASLVPLRLDSACSRMITQPRERLLRTRSRTATDRARQPANPPSFHAFVSKARRPAGSAFTLRYSQCSTAKRRSGVASLCQADRFGRACERALPSKISITRSSSRASRIAASQVRKLSSSPLSQRQIKVRARAREMMSTETSKKSQGRAPVGRRRQRIARRPSCTTRCGMRWHVVS